MKQIRIGSLFLESKHFVDDANKTIGRVALSSDVIIARRNVTAKVNDEGQKLKDLTVSYFKAKYGVNVKLLWDRFCGCTMCPCSPGFKIVAAVEEDYILPKRMTEADRFDVFIKGSKLDVREPKFNLNFDKIKIVANRKGV